MEAETVLQCGDCGAIILDTRQEGKMHYRIYAGIWKGKFDRCDGILSRVDAGIAKARAMLEIEE